MAQGGDVRGLHDARRSCATLLRSTGVCLSCTAEGMSILDGC